MIWKIGIFGGIAITILLLTSWYISVGLANKHRLDCNRHKAILDQLEKEFPNNGTLNGQLVLQIQYLNQHCDDVGLGNIRMYLEGSN